MPKQTPFDKAKSTLGALDHSALLTLRNLIDELLDVPEWQPDTVPDASAPGNQAAPGERKTGYRELKLINGYGPYAYYRRYDKGTLRSEYLGKASPGESERFWANYRGKHRK